MKKVIQLNVDGQPAVNGLNDRRQYYINKCEDLMINFTNKSNDTKAFATAFEACIFKKYQKLYDNNTQETGYVYNTIMVDELLALKRYPARFIELFNSFKTSDKKLLEYANYNFSTREKAYKGIVVEVDSRADSIVNSTAQFSTLEKCEKCGHNKTQYTMSQDRSSDEPMTIHFTCMNCGHEWKV